MSECTLNAASEDIADFIEQYGNIAEEDLYQRLQTDCIDIVNNKFVIAYRPLKNVAPLTFSAHQYFSIPNVYGLLDATAPEAAGISKALSNYHIDAGGQGVVIGFIDTGIDYRHPAFRNPDGTSRVVSIWDQTIQSPAAEQASLFHYGTTYSQAQIDAALASENPLAIVPSSDTNGHGTFMAGVAAGSTMPADSFTGAAPESMIAVVKLKPAKQYLRDFYQISPDAVAYQENDIMLGIRYLIQVATFLRAPLVIYIGVGTNQGDHSGSSPLALQIQDISSGLGTIFITGAGNETGMHHHYQGSLQPAQDYEDVEIQVAEDENGFCLELWGNPPELYTVGFVSPKGEVIEQIPNISRSNYTIPFVLSSSSITIYYLRVENGSGSSVVFIRFKNPAPGIWRVRVSPTVYFTGNFHIWLPMRNFISDNTYFLKPNPDTLVTDPGNSNFIMTVAAYDHMSRQIDINSSRGFSKNSTIVPDIAAPGVNIYGPSPLAYSTDNPGEQQARTPFTRKTGTSVAAAIVAGATAGYLSWNLARNNPAANNSASLHAFFIRGARRKPGLAYPSREWGYGTMDLYNSFQNV